MGHLNKSRGDKVEGYNLIIEAAEMGHKGALIKLAWGLLFGNYMEQNITQATDIFASLAEKGNADAHAVCYTTYISIL